MNRYIAFDVETPNRYNNRMSAIGIAVVEDGRIADTFYSLVDPEQPFDWFNTQLTGIDSEAVLGAPTFWELWPRIEPILSSGVLVAHNAPFDLGVLKKCLRGYGIEWRPQVPGLCTVRMGRRLLPGISHRLGDMCAAAPAGDQPPAGRHVRLLRHRPRPPPGRQRQPGLRRDPDPVHGGRGGPRKVRSILYHGVIFSFGHLFFSKKRCETFNIFHIKPNSRCTGGGMCAMLFPL